MRFIHSVISVVGFLLARLFSSIVVYTTMRKTVQFQCTSGGSGPNAMREFVVCVETKTYRVCSVFTKHISIYHGLYGARNKSKVY